MGIFRKKKKEDEDLKGDKSENFKEGSEEGRTVKVKKLKDLNSKNKKRRKEPIRPWNKFDRIVILLLIFLTVGISAYLALSSRGFSFPDLSKLKISTISIFPDRVVVVGPNKNVEIRDD